MIPLWLNAKKTVDGGLAELRVILEEERKKGEPEAALLKLALVGKELEILSMVSQINPEICKQNSKPGDQRTSSRLVCLFLRLHTNINFL